MKTQQEIYDLLTDEVKSDFAKVEAKEITFLEVAQKYGMTFRRRGQEYAKANFCDYYKIWRNLSV